MLDLIAWLAERGIKSPMCACDLPDGWLPLVDRLIADLDALGWDKDLHQVKEKFGGLRFYVGDHDDTIRDRIAAAEAESVTVCQTCGASGTLRAAGCWATLCQPCASSGTAASAG